MIVTAPTEHLQHSREAVKYFSDLGYSQWHVTVMTAWCLAELNWKFQEHAHHGGGEYQQTEWGPVLPHWK
jgi:hypothetical protein